MRPAPRVVPCFDWEAHYAKYGLAVASIAEERVGVGQQPEPIDVDVGKQVVAAINSFSWHELPTEGARSRHSTWRFGAFAIAVCGVVGGTWFGSRQAVMANLNNEVAWPQQSIDQSALVAPVQFQGGSIEPSPFPSVKVAERVAEASNHVDPATVLASTVADATVTETRIAELPQPPPVKTNLPTPIAVENVAPTLPAPPPRIVIRAAPVPKVAKPIEHQHGPAEEATATAPRSQLTGPTNDMTPGKPVAPATAIAPLHPATPKGFSAPTQSHVSLAEPDTPHVDKRVAAVKSKPQPGPRATPTATGAPVIRTAHTKAGISKNVAATAVGRPPTAVRKFGTGREPTAEALISDRPKARGRNQRKETTMGEYATVFGFRVKLGNPEWVKDLSPFNYTRN